MVIGLEKSVEWSSGKVCSGVYFNSHYTLTDGAAYGGARASIVALGSAGNLDCCACWSLATTLRCPRFQHAIERYEKLKNDKI